MLQLKNYTIFDGFNRGREQFGIKRIFRKIVRKSPGPRGGKRQTGRMKSKFNFSSLVDTRSMREDLPPVKPSHDYANSAIIYFSFALPFPSYPPLAAQTSRPYHPSTLSFGGELLLHGSSNFEVRTVFDVATNCSFAMQSSESRIKMKRQIIQVIEHRKVSNACSSTHLLFLSN